MKHLLVHVKNRKIQSIVLTVFLILGVVLFFYVKNTQVMPQVTIFFLNDVILPTEDQKVLIFSPHQDDETIAAGGYIAQSIKNKAFVRIVLVTDGNKYHLKKIRYKEFEKATSILGVKKSNLIFLNYPDGFLNKQNYFEVYNNFKTQIDNFNPDIIIYPHPLDSHPDHSTTGKIVKDILKNKKDNKIIAYQYLIHHHLFPQPKKFKPNSYLLPPINMVNFDKKWQRYVLPDDILDLKNQAVLSYQSQLSIPFLRSLLLSFIKKNELFSLDPL
jgi:LmbE family N-acetylglucosaminyl deacetylase